MTPIRVRRSGLLTVTEKPPGETLIKLLQWDKNVEFISTVLWKFFLCFFEMRIESFSFVGFFHHFRKKAKRLFFSLSFLIILFILKNIWKGNTVVSSRGNNEPRSDANSTPRLGMYIKSALGMYLCYPLVTFFLFISAFTFILPFWVFYAHHFFFDINCLRKRDFRSALVDVVVIL